MMPIVIPFQPALIKRGDSVLVKVGGELKYATYCYSWRGNKHAVWFDTHYGIFHEKDIFIPPIRWEDGKPVFPVANPVEENNDESPQAVGWIALYRVYLHQAPEVFPMVRAEPFVFVSEADAKKMFPHHQIVRTQFDPS